MENAANALGMAAAVLIFIIAIASSFSLFGTAKQTADSIIRMRDKQVYLESAELDNGILYTSSSAITEDKKGDIRTEHVIGVTQNGDRIVNLDDVISTIYRYDVENYSVTIIDEENFIIARYDTSLESYIKDYQNYGSDFFERYKEKVKENIKNDYCDNLKFVDYNDKIENLYMLKTGRYDSPWLGNPDNINKRINLDISGDKDILNDVEYKGKGLLEKLKDKKIIEVINEIDNSKYLEEELLQQYEMPTVEVIYIVY